MGFSYKPLFLLLLERNMKKTDLLSEAGLSSATLAKLGKGEPLSGESIEKLCLYFHCQPGDLVQYIFPDTSSQPADPEKRKVRSRQLRAGKKPGTQKPRTKQ